MGPPPRIQDGGDAAGAPPSSYAAQAADGPAAAGVP